MNRRFFAVLVLVPAFAFAQAVTPVPATDFSPPPLVPASPPPMPPAEPNAPPVSPSATPPPPGSYVPGQPGKSGYQYSPYGTPKAQEKPAPEIGLMVTETLFGALTAAGITVLPYFLLFNNGTLGEPVGSIIFSLIFGAAPLAVAQTQISLANGSRFYTAEMWIPALTGLVAQAGVLGLFALSAGGGFWLPTGLVSGGVGGGGGSVVWLMIGTIGLVPILQMVAINLFKTPRPGVFGVIGDPDKRLGIAFNPPTAAPILGPTARGNALGVQLSLLHGRF